MRFPRTVAALCAAVALSMLSTTTAEAGGSTAPASTPSIPESAAPNQGPDREPDRGGDQARAQDALATVIAAFEPAAGARRDAGAGPGRDLTMAMLELQRRLDDLAPADRERAEGYLARPTGDAAVEEVAYSKDADPTVQCGSDVCVTYAQATRDAPDLSKDNDRNGVPDQVDLTLTTFASVWERIVTQGGYRAPLGDDGSAQGEGPDGRFDVYLADVGDRFYGYCTIDRPTTRSRASSGYCVLDDDYSPRQFPSGTPLENLQVTAAHEFFHAVQFAYDFAEDLWFMEGTAAWMEDELYDEVNDNRQYLYLSPLTHPRSSMDDVAAFRNLYGSWIWWRFLAERHPRQDGTGLPTIIRDTWSRAAYTSPSRPGTYSAHAAASAVYQRGDLFRAAFARFHEVNRHPRTFYEEGAAYPTAPLAATHRISKQKRSVGSKVVLRQLSGATIAFTPHPTLTSSRWRLEVTVDAPVPSRGSHALLTVRRTNGTIATSTVRLNGQGKGKLTVPFGARSMKAVELTLANGSTRYQCDRGTRLTCAGQPLDHQLGTQFNARLRWQ